MRFKAYPIQVKPVFREMIWGGRDIARYVKIPSKGKIGEALYFCDNESCSSVIQNGAYKGMTVSKYMEKFGMQAIGLTAAAKSGRKFPLLVKYIDARDRLSVQVHPDEAAGRKIPGARPKSEMWYVLNASKKAGLFMGLKKKAGTDALRKAAESGAIVKMMSYVKVKSMDAYFLPAGVIHAIGGGNLILEIQQNSDTTYRLYDWGRKDPKGVLRQLHLNEALACAKPGLKPVRAGKKQTKKSGLGVRPLCRADFMSCSEISVDKTTAYMAAGTNACIIVFLKGAAEISHEDGVMKVKKGGVVFFPKNSAGYLIKFGAAGLAVAAEIR